jgi:hypothetical protein
LYRLLEQRGIYGGLSADLLSQMTKAAQEFGRARGWDRMAALDRFVKAISGFLPIG